MCHMVGHRCIYNQAYVKTWLGLDADNLGICADMWGWFYVWLGQAKHTCLCAPHGQAQVQTKTWLGIGAEQEDAKIYNKLLKQPFWDQKIAHLWFEFLNGPK